MVAAPPNALPLEEVIPPNAVPWFATFPNVLPPNELEPPKVVPACGIVLSTVPVEMLPLPDPTKLLLAQVTAENGPVVVGEANPGEPNVLVPKAVFWLVVGVPMVGPPPKVDDVLPPKVDDVLPPNVLVPPNTEEVQVGAVAEKMPVPLPKPEQK